MLPVADNLRCLIWRALKRNLDQLSMWDRVIYFFLNHIQKEEPCKHHQVAAPCLSSSAHPHDFPCSGQLRPRLSAPPQCRLHWKLGFLKDDLKMEQRSYRQEVPTGAEGGYFERAPTASQSQILTVSPLQPYAACTLRAPCAAGSLPFPAEHWYGQGQVWQSRGKMLQGMWEAAVCLFGVLQLCLKRKTGPGVEQLSGKATSCSKPWWC